VFRATGQPQLAVEQFEAAVALRPDYAEAQAALAGCLEALGKDSPGAN
jgi:Flp pilus assembly protein TadD